MSRTGYDYESRSDDEFRYAAEFTALVRERFTHWRKVCGRHVGLSFDLAPIDELVGAQAAAEGMSSPAVYNPVLNAVHVNVLHAVQPFKAMNRPDRDAMRRYIDAIVLHELGHRRDRFRGWPYLAVAWTGGILIALIVTASLLVEMLASRPAGWAVPAVGLVLVVTVALVAFASWFGQRTSWQHRMEVRADDHAADIGGIDAIDEYLWVLASYEVVDLMDGVYDPPQVRRERQWQRLTGHGVPADRRGAWGR